MLSRASKVIFVFIIAFTFFSSSAYAAKVLKAKGKKILVDLGDTDAQRGDFFYTITPKGKRAGVLKILQVRRGKAIAILGKGKARPGYSLKLRKPKRGDKKRARTAPTQLKKEGKPNSFWGIMVGGNSLSMDVDLPLSGETVNLTGSGYSFKLAMDNGVFNKLWFRGMLGMESISGAGDAFVDCDAGEDCDVEITYLTLDLWARLLFAKGGFRPWVGAGVDLMFPMSDDSNALDSDSITNTSLILAGLGFDILFTDTFSMPIQLEYGFFPASDQVEASLIAGRLGFMWGF
jgi:hypothetical protein